MPLAALAAGADAAFPSRPLRIVVPFTAGSATDVISRIVMPQLVERWGKQVVTDNRPSAGGIVACTIVAQAPADGGAGAPLAGMRPEAGCWRRR